MERLTKILAVSFLATILTLSFIATGAGESFTVGWKAEIPTLNPAKSWAEEANIVIDLMFDGLYTLDKDANPVPELIVEEEISEDTMTWDFTMTDQASWQDGQPLTADDVVYNLKVLTKTQPPQLTPNLEFIDSVEKTGPYSFSLNMKYQQPISLTKAMLEDLLGIWLPPHKLPPVEEMKLQDVLDYKPRLGSGPFEFEEWKKDQYLVLNSVQNYWQGAANIDKLVFRRFSQENAQVEALKSGQIDLAFELTSPTLVKSIEATSGVSVANTPSQWFHELVFNLTDWNENMRPALHQLEVRKALAHLVDVDKIVNLVWLGYAKRNPSILPSWEPYKDFYNEELEYYDFDVEKAKQILEENGWVDRNGDGIREKTVSYTIKPLALKDGKMQYNEEEGTIKRVPEDEWIEKEKTVKLDFSVWIETSYSIELRVFEIVKEAAKKAGIRLRPNVMEGAKMYDLIWGEDGYRGDYDMLGWGWNIGVDPTFVLSWLSMYQIGAYSDSNWHNAEFNRIYRNQAREVDHQKRIEMVKRAQELVHEQLPYVVMYWPDKLDGYSEDFQGYVQQDLVGLTQDLTFMNLKPKE